jgi:uncharacterized membrane protein (DUF4010 family)
MSPFKIWLVVVVISTISYVSYLMQKFMFPDKGIIITSILGGLYSSTATTVVLAKKSKEDKFANNQITASIFLATAMMFIRIFVFAYIFNTVLAMQLALPIGVILFTTLAIAVYLLKFRTDTSETEIAPTDNKNPLEFKTALVFALLFMVFAILTKYVLEYYGTRGLNTLALIVGVSDIDPFLLSLFTGKFVIAVSAMAKAALIAITSNNVLKLGYAIGLGNKLNRKPLIIGFGVIVFVSIIFIII